MKYSLEEMIFAAHVREIARGRREHHSRNMSDKEREAYLAQTANDVIVEVVQELEGIAHVIAKSRAVALTPLTKQ